MMKKIFIILLSILILSFNCLPSFASTFSNDGTVYTPNSIETTFVIYEDGSYEKLGDNNLSNKQKSVQPRGTITFKYQITSWSGSTLRHKITVTASTPDLTGMDGLVYVKPNFEQYVSHSCLKKSSFTKTLDSVNVGTATSVKAGYGSCYVYTTGGTIVVPDQSYTFYKSDF